jgi:hypothetical protein
LDITIKGTDFVGKNVKSNLGDSRYHIPRFKSNENLGKGGGEAV